MKKIFTLVAVLFSITSFAANNPGPRTSKIAISNSDRSSMQVKIDGKSYNLNNTFVIDNIKAGNHSIVITKTEVNGFRKTSKMIYNSNLYISSAQTVDIDINRSGKVQVKQTSLGRDDKNDRNDWNKGENKGKNDNKGRH